MFERFTDRARLAVVKAQEQSRLLQHTYIGPEHLLLGLIDEEEGLAARVLRDLDIDLAALSAEVTALVGRGDAQQTAHIPFTPAAKKALELALRESKQLGHNYIGTEHLLLALIRQGDGVAAQVLVQHGADLDTARRKVAELLAGRTGRVQVTMLTPEMTAIGEISQQLRVISQRLAAIEAKLGIEESSAQAELRQAQLELGSVRRAKEAAIDEQDFERAAQLRQAEKQLLRRLRAAEQAMLENPPADG